jgi:hypothetical protein
MTSDPRDYKVELSGGSGTGPAPAAGAAARPFLSVKFECCGAYQRIYRSRDGKSYAGRCPRCGKPVQFPIGAGGTTCRYFVVR